MEDDLLFQRLLMQVVWFPVPSPPKACTHHQNFPLLLLEKKNKMQIVRAVSDPRLSSRETQRGKPISIQFGKHPGWLSPCLVRAVSSKIQGRRALLFKPSPEDFEALQALTDAMSEDLVCDLPLPGDPVGLQVVAPSFKQRQRREIGQGMPRLRRLVVRQPPIILVYSSRRFDNDNLFKSVGPVWTACKAILLLTRVALADSKDHLRIAWNLQALGVKPPKPVPKPIYGWSDDEDEAPTPLNSESGI